MAHERVEQIKAIFQQGRQATKEFVDIVFNLSEKLFCVLVEDNQNQPMIENFHSPKRIMDKKELAQFLGISQRLISDLQNEGLPIIHFGRCVRFDIEEVLAWAKDKKRKVQKTKLRVVR